jgi:hypothetical protein
MGVDNVDNVDNVFLVGSLQADGRAVVDNVDNLFLNCPTCPQIQRIFWEKEKAGAKSVDKLDNVDNPF